MPKRKTVKQQITEAVLKEIPVQYSNDHTLPIEEVMFRWWQTGRQEGLRLTPDGVVAFQLAEIEYFDCDFPAVDQSWHSFLLELGKKIKCPYFIGSKKPNGKKNVPFIRFYDSKIAMMVALYGDLRGYLDSIKLR